jgi:hypothetical protein
MFGSVMMKVGWVGVRRMTRPLRAELPTGLGAGMVKFAGLADR